MREQGVTEEQITVMLFDVPCRCFENVRTYSSETAARVRHCGSKSAGRHWQPPFCLPRHPRRRPWSCHSPSINGSSSSRSATSSGCKFSFGSTDRVNRSFGPNSSGAWMI